MKSRPINVIACIGMLVLILSGLPSGVQASPGAPRSRCGSQEAKECSPYTLALAQLLDS